MVDLVQECHARRRLAALVTADIGADTLNQVDRAYRLGRFTPSDKPRLELVRAPELLGADVDAAKAYAREIFQNVQSQYIPCFFLVIDDRTLEDGSIVFVQQDWAGMPDDYMRTYPLEAYSLFIGFLLFNMEWDDCEEFIDEHGLYRRQINRTDKQRGVVRIPCSEATLVRTIQDQQVWALNAESSEMLGLSAVQRSIKNRRKVDGNFAEHLTFEVKLAELGELASQVQVWRLTDYFDWHTD